MRHRGDVDHIEDIYDLADDDLSASGLARAFGFEVDDDHMQELNFGEQISDGLNN